MPRSKDPDHYPKQYADVSRQCAIENKTIVLKLRTKNEAFRMRQHFYAFTASLGRVQALVERQKREPSLEEARWLEVLKQVRRTQVWVEEIEDGWRVKFQPKEQSWQALAIEQAVVIQNETLPSQKRGEEDFFSKMVQVQDEVNKDKGLPPVSDREDIPPEAKEKLQKYGHRGDRE